MINLLVSAINYVCADLEQGCCRACVGCPYAYAFGNGWCNSVYCYLCVDSLWFCACSIDYYREWYITRAACECFLRIFIEQFPSWCYLNNDITADNWVEPVSDFLYIVVSG